VAHSKLLNNSRHSIVNGCGLVPPVGYLFSQDAELIIEAGNLSLAQSVKKPKSILESQAIAQPRKNSDRPVSFRPSPLFL